MNGITPEERAELRRLIDEQFPSAEDLRLSDGSSPNDDWPLWLIAVFGAAAAIVASFAMPLGWWQ